MNKLNITTMNKLNIKTNMQNIKFLANNINHNKSNNISNHENYKLLICKIIELISNIYPEINSKKFMYDIIKANKYKMEKHNKKLNIKDFLYHLYTNDIILSYLEENIQTYSDGVAYDYIFLLEAKPRFIILLFLYFGFIKDIVQQNYIENLNAALSELLSL